MKQEVCSEGPRYSLWHSN